MKEKQRLFFDRSYLSLRLCKRTGPLYFQNSDKFELGSDMEMGADACTEVTTHKSLPSSENLNRNFRGSIA